jgi:hypothetical protein
MRKLVIVRTLSASWASSLVHMQMTESVNHGGGGKKDSKKVPTKEK